MDEAVSLLVVFLALWGGHWMPWSVIPVAVDREQQLHRPLAYAYGCMCIFGGFILWATLLNSRGVSQVSIWRAVYFLAFDIVAAGAGTMLPRGARLLREYWALRADKQDYEQALANRS